MTSKLRLTDRANDIFPILGFAAAMASFAMPLNPFLVGFILAGVVLILLGRQVAALGSELLGSAAIAPLGWAVLVALPAFGVILAMLVARLTILRALGRML